MSRFLCAFAFVCALLRATLCCCEAEAPPSKDTNAPGSQAHLLNGVRSITLPHFEPELAVAPGRDAFMVVCVSCHSPRYVTMQPPFPQRQWEETVDKMAKVFGAQMDQEQRRAIVGYLVTIHGPNTNAGADPSQDEESELVSGNKLLLRAQPAPLLKLAADAMEHATEVNRAAGLFQQDCAACHGTAGRGDGFVGQVLLRKPKDLAATRFSLRLLSQVLWDGKPGTAMPSWRSLPERDLTALAAYVQSLHQPAKAERASPEILQQGNKIFLQNCAPCHGVLADGKGVAAANLIPGPANFKLKQPDSAYILQVLSDGIPGTAMPSWKDQISESDRRALASFVRSVFEPANSIEH